jgi:hypothetical protein
MWAGEMDAFEAWTEGMEPERVAFLRVMLYHQRDGAASCTGGCPILLGRSFAEHQWDEFVRLRGNAET